jgi:hypothetical protein
MSDGALVTSVCLAVLLGVTAAVWRDAASIPLACSAIGVGAFSLWGIAERELTDPLLRPSPRRERFLRAAKPLLVIIGGAGLAVSIAFVMHPILGTWIS